VEENRTLNIEYDGQQGGGGNLRKRWLGMLVFAGRAAAPFCDFFSNRFLCFSAHSLEIVAGGNNGEQQYDRTDKRQDCSAGMAPWNSSVTVTQLRYDNK